MLRPFTHFACFGFLSALLTRPSLAAPTTNDDPCIKVAGKAWVDPVDALACVKSFPFNDTLRQNVLSVVSRVFDFYTFELFYASSPDPFQESTTDIRGQIQRISSTQYQTDYDFNLDLYSFTNQMNDGHTRWLPNCYFTFNNILPAPVVLLDNDVFIIPNSVKLLEQFGPGFTSYYDEKGFDWRRLAGAKVIEIGGLPALDYIDQVAKTASGNYLDHNIRVNSVVSSYRIIGQKYSQRLGDLASELFLQQTSLEFKLITKGSSSSAPETVDVPFIAAFIGNIFTDGPSYWANNCAASNATNGVDLISTGDDSGPHSPWAALPKTGDQESAISLLHELVPTLNPIRGNTSPIKSYILPGNNTGVMYVSTFGGDQVQTQIDMAVAIDQFYASGVTNLVIDLTNNPGGYVCLGLFLYRYLTGATSGIPGFESSSRANPLAQKILEAVIAKRISSQYSVYSGGNWLFPNGTQMPDDYNYNNPSNHYELFDQDQPTSQRFTDQTPCNFVPRGLTMPTIAPFDLNNVVLIGNGNCASTCALFTTLMYERHDTQIATFGANLNKSMEFKGMAGNQVLDWVKVDSEIKTAGLKDDPLAPPDLLVSANMRLNWRTAYSYMNENLPIAYVSEQPQRRFPYTEETFNNPQKLWTFVEKTYFGGD